jgi:hypothetical protein
MIFEVRSGLRAYSRTVARVSDPHACLFQELKKSGGMGLRQLAAAFQVMRSQWGACKEARSGAAHKISIVFP